MPPVQVAISLLVGGLDTKNALIAAYQSRLVPLGFDRFPPPSENRLRAHDTPSLATSGLTGYSHLPHERNTGEKPQQEMVFFRL